MFDIPYSRLNTTDILNELNAEPSDSSGVHSCPICRDRNSLTVKEYGGNCHCASCGFRDDILGLYAKATNQGLKDAVDTLWRAGKLPRGIRGMLPAYYASRRLPDMLEKLWQDSSDRIYSNTYASVMEILRNLGIGFRHGQDPRNLSKWCGAVHKSHLSPFAGAPGWDSLIKWTKGQACLLIPIFEDQTRPVGVMLIRKDLTSNMAFLDSSAAATSAYTLFTRRVLPTTNRVVMFNDPTTAVVMNLKEALCGSMTQCVGLVAGPNLRAPKPLAGLYRAEQVWYCDKFHEAYAWAREQKTGRVSTYDWAGSPNTLGLQKTLQTLADTAQKPPRAVAEKLLSLSEDAAYQLVAALDLTAAERNAVISAADVVDQARCSEYLSESMSSSKVEWAGKVISHRSDGWFCENEHITNAVLHLDTVIVQSTDYTVTGSIKFLDKVYPFTAPLDKVKKGGSWVERYLLDQGAPHLPYIQKKWSGRLYEIAVLFNQPSTQQTSAQSRWTDSGRRLIMPNFTITDGVVEPRTDLNPVRNESCAGVSVPPEMGEEEANDIQHDAPFWRIMLHLLGKLTEPWHGQQTPSLILTGEHAQSWLDALRSGLNLRQDTLSHAVSLLEREKNAVLPIIVAMVGGNQQRKWLNTDYHNAIISTELELSHLLAYQGWVVYAPDAAPDALSTEHMAQIFNMLADMFGAVQFDAGVSVYRTIGLYLQSWLQLRYADIRVLAEQVHRASADSEAVGVSGSGFLRLLVSLTDTGAVTIIPDTSNRWYEVNWENICDCFKQYDLIPPTYKNVRKMMQESGLLYDGRAPARADRNLFLAPESWNLAVLLK